MKAAWNSEVDDWSVFFPMLVGNFGDDPDPLPDEELPDDFDPKPRMGIWSEWLPVTALWNSEVDAGPVFFTIVKGFCFGVPNIASAWTPGRTLWPR